MDNPFRPGFGESPTVWAGRTPILENFSQALGSPGSTGRSLLINGSRGIGKTALLNELEEVALTHGWITLRAPSHSGMIDKLVGHALPAALSQHKDHSSPIVADSSITTPEPTHPINTPQVTKTLTSLLRELAGAVTGVLITVDEIQAANTQDLNRLATSIQDAIRDDLPVAFIGAGLTAGVAALLEHPGTTFLRRSLRYQLAPLTNADSARLVRETVAASSKSITPEATNLLTERAYGYPYLIQLIGSFAWELSDTTIGIDEVTEATAQAIPIMGNQVHLPEVSALSHRQVEFLQAMARVAEVDTASMKSISEELGKPVTSLSTLRHALLGADLVRAPAWGMLQFRLPYFREFLLGPGGPLEVA